MRVLTIFRAMAWFGVVVVFWSLNVRWGTDVNLPNGPPTQWHKAVVGCGLLAFIAAIALSASGRRGNPPSWLARGIAGGCALIIVIIAYSLYSKAAGNPMYEDMAAGTGWTWLAGGAGMVSSAVIGTLGLQKLPEKKNKGGKRRSGGKSRKRR